MYGWYIRLILGILSALQGLGIHTFTLNCKRLQARILEESGKQNIQ